ncbi:MAG TPA: amino acid adenylation domain-containing protein [Candidatus Angelobacter sp.]|nr:amino acid adenylation domain-containing protein [Candidatus Angelobacter sp.]
MAQIAEWNQTRQAYEQQWCIHELIQQRVCTQPQAVAVADGQQILDYADLNRRANQLARYLREHAVREETLVGVCLEREAELVVALLAVMKAGASYVPLDPEYPQQRLSSIQQDAQFVCLITRVRFLELFRGECSRAICIDRDREEIGRQSDQDLLIGVQPDNLAYVIYTSGSTGKPKGVALSHHALVNFVQWHLRSSGIAPKDRVSQLAAMTFDASVFEIWPHLCAGSSLHFVDEESRLNPEALADWIAEENITITFVPTALAEQVMLEPALWKSSLRLMLTGGDRLRQGPPPEAAFLLCNHYGPTEATVAVTAGPVPPKTQDPRTPHIGRPIWNAQVHLLDDQFEMVGVGTPGELYIAGKGLARGYISGADLTAERFLPNPFSEIPGDRMYRTGDRVRWREDGNLEFLGRMDEQVKIRGFRIEPQEIEVVLNQRPGIRESAVVAQSRASEEKQLVAYVVPVPGVHLDIKALRNDLGLQLPAYMLPAAIIVLEALPLTPNGKLDRRALPTPEEAMEPGAEKDGGPSKATEEILAGVWAEVLGLAEVGVNQNFFELGGHSLLATRVISRIRAIFQVDLPVRELFQHGTVRTLAHRIEEARKSGLAAVPPIVHADRQNYLPLSYAQQRMLFVNQLDPGNRAYNIGVALKLIGKVQFDLLNQAVAEIVRRHEVLRTRYVWMEKASVQVVEPEGKIAIELIELPAQQEDETREQEISRILREQMEGPFDLSAGPLLRMTLVQAGGEEYVLALSMHHIVSDGWSLGVFLRELSVLYEAALRHEPSPLPELQIQYGDYAVWQREWLGGGELERQMSYWKNQLQGTTGVLDLPTDGRRPATPSHRAGLVEFALPAETTQKIKQLSRAQGVTPYMMLLATLQIVLGRHAGQEDVTVGTVIAGRNRVETESLIGLFVNTLVMRASLEGNPSFQDLLCQVRKTVLEAYEHQDLPFDKLVEELNPDRSLLRTPLFQVMFTLQNARDQEMALGPLQLKEYAATAGETAKFELTIALKEGPNGLVGVAEYEIELFHAERIRSMLQHWRVLLEAALEEPNRSVLELPLLGPQERTQLLQEWNDTGKEYKHEASVLDFFEQQALASPGAVAASAGGHHLSYAELNRRGNQLAHYLRKLGAKPEVVVGICMERSLEMVISILGVLKAGAAYLPVDPVYPVERMSYMLTDAQVLVLLTQTKVCSRLPQDFAPVICIDDQMADIARESTDNLKRTGGPENLFYVIYTSGSTGRPKGVCVTQRNVINHMIWMLQEFPFSSAEQLLQKTALAFDASVWEFFGPWMSGTRVILLPSGPQDADFVLRTIATEQVTRLQFVPSALNSLLVLKEFDSLAKSLQTVFAGGESLAGDVPARFFPHVSADFHNIYGPTETTIISTFYRIRRGGEFPFTVPIGKPILNTQLYVLDALGGLVPAGVAGELYIAGDGVARGYLGRPALTAEKFLPNPFGGKPGDRFYHTGDRVRWRFDGNIEFLGRVDQQAKIRGYRIELEEIEAILRDHEAVHEAALVVREDAQGDNRLLAYVVRKSGIEVTAKALKDYLRRRLPEYMVPAAIMVLDNLPMTATGKLDRRALPDPTQEEMVAEEEYQRPWTQTEEMMAQIWAIVLNRQRVGLHDNFFELGGHSLLATQIMVRVQDSFHAELSLRALFENPTVASLAAAVENAHHSEWVHVVRVPRDQDLPLSYLEEFMWSIEQQRPGTTLYNSPSAVILRESLNLEALEKSLDTLHRRHEALRTAFQIKNGVPVRVVFPPARYALPVVDLQGIDKSRQRAEVQRLYVEEAGRPFELERGPLLRFKILKLAEEEHAFLMTAHHIVFDGWSAKVLAHELDLLYQAYCSGTEVSLADLPVQYADFAVWQRQLLQGEQFDRLANHWKAHLEGMPPLVQLPRDRLRPAVVTFAGANLRFIVQKSQATQVREFARAQGVTLFMLMSAVFTLLISRHTGLPDVVLAVPDANRGRSELEGVIGTFNNTLLMRLRPSWQLSFRKVLAGVRDAVLSTNAHRDLPFKMLVDVLHPKLEPSHLPLFQVMLDMLNLPDRAKASAGPSGSKAGVEVLPLPEKTDSKLELTLYVQEIGEEIQFHIIYAAGLFSSTRMAEFAQQFQLLLGLVVQYPEMSAGRYSLVTDAAKSWLSDPCAALSLRVDEIFPSRIGSRIAEQKKALQQGHLSWTYAQINVASNQLAHQLIAGGIRRGDVVALSGPLGGALVIAIVAVLKAGAAFMVLDPDSDSAHTSVALRKAEARGLIHVEELSRSGNVVMEFSETEGFCCRITTQSDLGLNPDAGLGRFPGEAPDLQIEKDDCAFLICDFEAGEAPIGITHAQVANFIHWMTSTFALRNDEERFGIFPNRLQERVLHDVLLPLWLGATLVVSGEYGGKTEEIEWMDREKITVTLWTTQMLRCFCGSGNAVLPSIKLVSLSGDRINGPDVQHLRHLVPAATCVCLYQAPNFAAPAGYCVAQDEFLIRNVMPIGRAVPGIQLMVINPQNQLAGIGELGEIYVRTAGSLAGYQGAQAPIPNWFTQAGEDWLLKTGDYGRYLPDGNIEYSGGQDHWGTIDGYQVQFEEIESILLSHPSVRQVVVKIEQDATADDLLVAYVVPSVPDVHIEDVLRDHMKANAPAFMSPSIYVQLVTLPLQRWGAASRAQLKLETRPAAGCCF